ncbi:MAG TPA: hypothetical protein VMV00_01580, partial [Candidatus Baltobacteraceae bacterium]|nr:hypothetical protein [Candidatus Baltobacteraceae bacterium]
FGAFFFNTTIGKRATTLSISDKNALKLLRVAAQKVLESTDVKLLVGVQVYPTKRIYEEGRGGKINSLQYGEALTLKEIKKYLPTYTKDVELSHHMTKTG